MKPETGADWEEAGLLASSAHVSSALLYVWKARGEYLQVNPGGEVIHEIYICALAHVRGEKMRIVSDTQYFDVSRVVSQITQLYEGSNRTHPLRLW